MDHRRSRLTKAQGSLLVTPAPPCVEAATRPPAIRQPTPRLATSSRSKPVAGIRYAPDARPVACRQAWRLSPRCRIRHPKFRPRCACRTDPFPAVSSRCLALRWQSRLTASLLRRRVARSRHESHPSADSQRPFQTRHDRSRCDVARSVAALVPAVPIPPSHRRHLPELGDHRRNAFSGEPPRRAGTSRGRWSARRGGPHPA